MFIKFRPDLHVNGGIIIKQTLDKKTMKIRIELK
jgi:hypothetical protein